MTLDVVFSPLGLTPAEVSGRMVVVIDVLRATTTICAALDHGARTVIVASDTQEATHYAQALDSTDVLLAGERNAVAIPGFHLGNSPLEMTREVVEGKTLVMTTTNGTRAMLATAGAREVIVASGVNLTAAGMRARAGFAEHGDLLILCAGRPDGFGMDDAYIAGRLATIILGGRRHRKGLNDAALVALDLAIRYGDRVERVLGMSRAGRELIKLGFRGDVEAAAAIDSHPVVPGYHEHRITLVPAVAG